MYRTVKAILIGLLFVSVYFGSTQIGQHNNVFASAMLRCCNNGLCHNASCSAGSSILPCSGSEYASTCLRCMGIIDRLDSCGKYLGPLPTWCVMPDGTKYYTDDWE